MDLPELTRFGACLVAISPQTPDQSLSTAEKAGLDFTVLSDPGSRLARQIGVAFQPADEVLAARRNLGLDLAQVNAEGSTELPMPTVVIIDREHTIRFVDIQRDVDRAGERRRSSGYSRRRGVFVECSAFSAVCNRCR